MTTALIPLDVPRIRQDFPVLTTPFHGKPVVYLDSAVSSLTPLPVVARMGHYQSFEHTNVHRGVSTLSQEATDRFEEAREKVRAFINAPSTRQVIWTRGTTESINLVAQTFGRQKIHAGDEILLSAMEHHSDIVPWQLLAEDRGARIRVIPMNDAGELILDNLEDLITDRTRILGVTHVSNVLGTINPVKEIIRRAHAKGVPVLVDGAQAVPHIPVDVTDLDADFYAFSGHKLSGPTGIGVLYGRKSLLEAMPPWHGGGSMILSVTWEGTTFAAIPGKFEAGTPPIAQAIGLGAAIDYVRALGLDRIAAHEHELLAYATERLKAIPGLRIIGEAREKASVLSFVLEGIHPHDIGSILDHAGVVVRAGHHCAQPVMTRFGIPATTRASFAYFNTRADVDALVSGILNVQEIFS
ncbi:aminotransferase class V-fold PLP-dependent enzyme [Mesoterricola silvestris]|uniref:Probable cysteine desulfurase n=1 Tax=Mesoterricola silvestris TaxID=2927979 RepID=A0AA48KA84_9BACT|nr:cysteine desulfurase [Mesoterricola silvestris]BDU73850.1 cysteine desulfurase [Mesoterricola silvestris]